MSIAFAPDSPADASSRLPARFVGDAPPAAAADALRTLAAALAAHPECILSGGVPSAKVLVRHRTPEAVEACAEIDAHPAGPFLARLASEQSRGGFRPIRLAASPIRWPDASDYEGFLVQRKSLSALRKSLDAHLRRLSASIRTLSGDPGAKDRHACAAASRRVLRGLVRTLQSAQEALPALARELRSKRAPR